MSVRYLIFGIDRKGNLLKPVTSAISDIHVAFKYFSDCENVSLVSIDDFGTIKEIIKTNLTKEIHKPKQKYINRKH